MHFHRVDCDSEEPACCELSEELGELGMADDAELERSSLSEPELGSGDALSSRFLRLMSGSALNLWSQDRSDLRCAA